MDKYNISDDIQQATCAVLDETGKKAVGTAWLVSADGYLLTAGHLLASRQKKIIVKFPEDESVEIDVVQRVLDSDAGIDFAVLKSSSIAHKRKPLPIRLEESVTGEFQFYGYGETFIDISSGRGKFSGNYLPQDNRSNTLFLLKSQELEPGCSGAAIVSDNLQAVVAIHIQGTPMSNGARCESAVAMPLYRVAKYWDGLHEIASSKELPFDFDPDFFVNREEERKHIFDIICKKRSESCCFEYTGCVGVGKTILLKYFCYIATEKCFASYIDFQSRAFSCQSIIPIIEQIADSFSHKKEAATAFSHFDEKLRESNGNKEGNIIEYFINCLVKLSLNNKIILCFDNIDYADVSVVQQIEEFLVERLLVNYENFIFVFASQKIRRWTSNKIRFNIRNHRHQLKLLNKNDIEKLIERFLSRDELYVDNKADLVNLIYRITTGHPLNCKKCIYFLSDEFSKSLTSKNIEENHGKCVQMLIDKVVKRQIEELELDKDCPSAEEIISYLSLLRYIDLPTFYFILSPFLPVPSNFINKLNLYFEKIVVEFQKQTDIITRLHEECFKVEDTIRNIFISDFMVNRKNEFVEIQRVLIRQYDILAKKRMKYGRIKDIIELLYHTVFLAKIEKKDAVKEVEKVLSEYLAYSVIQSHFLSLEDALQNDEDLNEMLDRQISLKYFNVYKNKEVTA